MTDKSKITAIVLAGGKGSRMNSDIPKQYMILNDKPVLYYSLRAFEESCVSEVVLVAGAADIKFCKEQIVDQYGFKKVVSIVAGGKERYDSVMSGLNAVSPDADYVFIHDGARPCISQDVIQKCACGVKEFGACVAAVKVKDTIKVADEQDFAVDTPDRNTLWQIQTPQCFEYKLVYEAYKKMKADNNKGNITDDAMVVESYSERRVKMISGEYENIKITTPKDIMLASVLLKDNG